MNSIRETEADEVWVTHGYTNIVVRHLQETGLNAKVVETEFLGELIDQPTFETEVESDG